MCMYMYQTESPNVGEGYSIEGSLVAAKHVQKKTLPAYLTAAALISAGRYLVLYIA